MNIGFLSLDILILIVIFVLLFGYSMKTSKKFLVSLTISIYPALIIFNNFPYVNFESGIPNAIAFILIYVISHVVVYKFLAKKSLHTTSRKVFDYALLSITYIFLLLSISANFVPSLQYLYTFTGIIPNLISKIDPGLMLIIPLLSLFLTSKSDKY